MAERKRAEKSTRKPIQARALATMETILQAAARVFEREGFERGSTNRIAEVAGVGIGSLYQYFGNKDEIILSLIRRNIRNQLGLVRIELEKHQARDLRSAATAVIQTLIEAKARQSKLEAILETQVSHRAGSRIMRALDEELLALLMDFVAPHLPSRKPDDLEFALYTVIQALKGAMILTNVHRPEYVRSRRFSELLTEMAMAGLTA